MPATAKKRITKRTVDGLKPDTIVWDTSISGFGVRRQRDRKVYILKTRVGGRQRWLTIGAHGSPWTVDTARTEALSILGAIANGKDPAALRDAHKANPTIANIAEMFLREHVETKRKRSTAHSYRDFLERIALPALGTIKAVNVTRSDIAKLHHSLKDTPYQANRVLAVLSKMFSWTEQRGYRPDGSNPCRHVEKYPERGRERFLSEAEMARLAEVLAKEEEEGLRSPHVVAAIRLLVFTGARLSEILELQWDHVDIERTMLLLPDSKTGKKVIYLNAPALEVLTTLPRLEGNPFVIVGKKDGAHLVNLQKPWRAIRQRARLDDVRLHDLRHSFASVAAAGGASLLMIGKLLGHTQSATTERYAHLAADPLRAANEAIGQHIAAAMKPQSSDGRLVNLKSRS